VTVGTYRHADTMISHLLLDEDVDQRCTLDVSGVGPEVQERHGLVVPLQAIHAV
jgi:hypothetical protein